MLHYKSVLSNNSFEGAHGDAYFCATPSQASLKDVFENLIHPRRTFFLAYFSDDSCLTIRDDDGQIHRYNVDISSCDSSHRSTFALLRDLAPEYMKNDINVLIEQLSLPVKVLSEEKDENGRNYQMSGQFTCPRLFSGSVVTTCLNNIAELLFACALDDVEWSTDRVTIQNQITQAFESVGFMCTTQECKNVSELQFLKHSPVYDNRGVLQPMLNIGVLLRLSGTCTYDLPGRGDIVDRARVFQHSLLQGVYVNARFNLIDNMRKTCATEKTIKNKKIIEDMIIGKDYVKYNEPTFFNDCDVYARYGLRPHEYEELNYFFSIAQYGDVVSCDAIDTIMNLDYSLGVRQNFTVEDHNYVTCMSMSHVGSK
jgi:hypothetical protein